MEAASRIDSQQLSAQLVVCKLRQQDLVLSHGASKPSPNVAILAWMADLAEHTCVEKQSHRADLSTGPVELRRLTG